MMLNIFLVMTIAAVAKASYFEIDTHGFHQLPFQPRLISQSVHLKEVPTKVIRITKTVAIRVPVPYPVKVPHHVPFPVPVNQPVAVPVPQIVKVPHHVPVEIQKPYPVEVHQQVPLIVSKPIAFPHPVPVPHPVTINRPVYYPVPHPVPYPQSVESSHSDYSDSNAGTDHNYLSRSFDRDHHHKDSANEGDESNAQSYQLSQHDLTQGKDYGSGQGFSSSSQNYQMPQDFSQESKDSKEMVSEQNFSSGGDYNGKNYGGQY